VEKESEVPINEIHLLNGFYWLMMYYLVENNENHVVNRYLTSLFLLWRSADELVQFLDGDLIFSVRFYNQSLKSPLQSINLLKGSKLDSMPNTFPSDSRRLDFPNATSLLVSEWMSVNSTAKSALKTQT
jgi:hypothetical protein